MTTYRLHCSNWALANLGPHFIGGRDVQGWSNAVQKAKAYRTATNRCNIYRSNPSGHHLIAVIDERGRLRAPRHGDDYTRPSALHGPLTDMVCDSSLAEQKIRDAMSTAAISAAMGGTLAAVSGALLKKPLLGAFVGAGVGWVTYALWTAPLRT